MRQRQRTQITEPLLVGQSTYIKLFIFMHELHASIFLQSYISQVF